MNILKIILIIVTMFFSINLKAQSASAAHFIDRITFRLKDSLDLSKEQMKEIYSINKKLEEEKSAVWSKYTDDNDIRKGLQSIENKRDSLYQTVFTKQQFILYKEKKMHLLNNK